MIHPDIPFRALSIQQPWAWLIVNGHKNIENRDWSTKFRGPVAIHAGKKVDADAAWEMSQGVHPVSGERLPLDHPAFQEADKPWSGCFGGIVGVAEIVDCVSRADSDWKPEYSEWFVGKYGFVIANARPVEFIPVRGALSFFDWRRNL